MKKGDKIYLIGRTKRDNTRVVETKIASIGSKYITTTYDNRVKFNVKTLMEVDAYGYSAYLVVDIESYYQEQEYRKLCSNLSSTKWDLIKHDKLTKIMKILEGDNNVK